MVMEQFSLFVVFVFSSQWCQSGRFSSHIPVNKVSSSDATIATGWHIIITGISVIGAAIGRSTKRAVTAGNLFVERRRCPVLVGSEESKPTAIDRVPLCGTSFRVIVPSVSWYIQVTFGSVTIGWWGAFGWRRVTVCGQFFVTVGVILVRSRPDDHDLMLSTTSSWKLGCVSEVKIYCFEKVFGNNFWSATRRSVLSIIWPIVCLRFRLLYLLVLSGYNHVVYTSKYRNRSFKL